MRRPVIKSLAQERAEKCAVAMAPLSKAELDVLAERRRQPSKEGWTPEHDDEHDDGSLAQAAACYAYGKRIFVADVQGDPRGDPPAPDRFHNIRDAWPANWHRRWWKPKDRRRDLVRAGALILAEIERLDRLPAPSQGED